MIYPNLLLLQDSVQTLADAAKGAVDNNYSVPWWLLAILLTKAGLIIAALWRAMDKKDKQISAIVKEKNAVISAKTALIADKDAYIAQLHIDMGVETSGIRAEYGRQIDELEGRIESLQNRILSMLEKDAEFWKNRHSGGN